MNGHAALVRQGRALAVVLCLCAAGFPVRGAEVNVTRTNWVERWITNLIEVQMPLNRFVNEYHTNCVTQFHTNVLEVYTTNHLTRTVTNHALVDAFQTNFVTAYQTNWNTLDLTNWETVIVMKTNWLARTLTNQYLVDTFQTNVVTAYHTNWKTLDLTNWQTAIVMKTNWVTQVFTNVVQTDVPAPSATSAANATTELAEPKEARVEASPSSAVTASGITLEASRTARPPNKDQVEVQLRVKGSGDSAGQLQVNQWRVEREDRAILCFGQDQDFKRELPAGRYKVEVKVRLDADSAPLSVRGTLVLTAREAVIQQTLAAKR